MPTTFTKETKPTATYTKQVVGYGIGSFLLKEDGGNLLLESGDRITLIDGTAVMPVTAYTKETKP